MIVCLSVCNRVKGTFPVTKLTVRRWEALGGHSTWEHESEVCSLRNPLVDEEAMEIEFTAKFGHILNGKSN